MRGVRDQRNVLSSRLRGAATALGEAWEPPLGVPGFAVGFLSSSSSAYVASAASIPSSFAAA